jgi:hypothetical protein
MSVLTFTTSGKMTIILYGAQFGNVLTDPDNDPNVKTFDRTQPSKLYLEVQDERKFAPWGKIQVIVQGPNPTMAVTIDTNAVAFYGTAQFDLAADNGQHIISDNFQSAVGGVPNSGQTKTYPIR